MSSDYMTRMQLISDWLENLGPEMVKARQFLSPVAAKFAERIGVSRQTLDQWEKKEYKGCGMQTYIKVIKALENEPIFSQPPDINVMYKNDDDPDK